MSMIAGVVYLPVTVTSSVPRWVVIFCLQISTIEVSAPPAALILRVTKKGSRAAETAVGRTAREEKALAEAENMVMLRRRRRIIYLCIGLDKEYCSMLTATSVVIGLY